MKIKKSYEKGLTNNLNTRWKNKKVTMRKRVFLSGRKIIEDQTCRENNTKKI